MHDLLFLYKLGQDFSDIQYTNLYVFLIYLHTLSGHWTQENLGVIVHGDRACSFPTIKVMPHCAWRMWQWSEPPHMPQLQGVEWIVSHQTCSRL